MVGHVFAAFQGDQMTTNERCEGQLRLNSPHALGLRARSFHTGAHYVSRHLDCCPHNVLLALMRLDTRLAQKLKTRKRTRESTRVGWRSTCLHGISTISHCLNIQFQTLSV